MKTNRRTFLKTMGTIGLFSIVPRKVLGGNGFISPSDQLTKGIIGVGGIGKSSYHFTSSEACRLVSVCDVDQKHLQQAVDLGKKKFGTTLTTYHDFRDLIGDPNVDIVHIATPPHWHALMAVEAARAGKDVWCEKPMTRTIGEGSIIRKTKRSEKIKRSDVFRKTKCSFFDFPTHNLKTPQKTLGRFKFLNDKNLTHSNRTSRSHYHQAVALFALNCSRICVHFRDSV